MDKEDNNSPTSDCQNTGCAMKYVERGSNLICQYHPGTPVFHEGYKFWSCCKKKTIVFDEFMNQKGCTEGEHCWIPKKKPPPEVKNDIPPFKEVIMEEVRPKLNVMKRPDMNSNMIPIVTTIAPNFQKALETAQSAAQKLEDLQTEQCQNAGCFVLYRDKESHPNCFHHPGEPIFHEGLKYWSCCKKKSMEFEEFMKQKGCTEGEEHCWTSRKKVDCRYDWHQTGSHVIVTIYAKGYTPSDISIKANAVRLGISIPLPAGVFEKDFVLHGIILEGESSACLMSTKVEIKLKKAEPIQWTNFELQPNSA